MTMILSKNSNLNQYPNHKIINTANPILSGPKSPAIHGGLLLLRQFLVRKIPFVRRKRIKSGALCKNLILWVEENIESILSLTKHSNIFIDWIVPFSRKNSSSPSDKTGTNSTIKASNFPGEKDDTFKWPSTRPINCIRFCSSPNNKSTILLNTKTIHVIKSHWALNLNRKMTKVSLLKTNLKRNRLYRNKMKTIVKDSKTSLTEKRKTL